MKQTAEIVLDMITKSPTAFHAVELMSQILESAGFQELKETERWELQPGGKYFVVRNQTSMLSFFLPEEPMSGFRLIASHSDSPCFKVKVDPEMDSAGSCVRLNTERYGGMIHGSWFDRPLSIAGRVIYQRGGKLESGLINVDRDLLMIPSLAAHMESRPSKGAEFNPQKELLPILAQWSYYPAAYNSVADIMRTKPTVTGLAAKELGIDISEILSGDLFVYNRMPPAFWGANNEFIAAPRLDDLECCFSSFLGFFNAAEHQSYRFGMGASSSVMVHAVFDNEEVGSGTAQGADSTFLAEVLERISLSCGFDRAAFMSQIASSFMISADNAHAVHPNYAECADPVSQPEMNGGIVLKHNANQKYTTDAVSGAMVIQLCEKHNIPFQHFVNRSDMSGGSTLGNIAQAHVSMRTADIGLAQMAMHSSYESAGSMDPEYLKRFAEVFYAESDDLFRI